VDLALQSLMRFLGLLVAFAFLGLILFDGALMLLWPEKWLRLPPYIGLQGVYLKPGRHLGGKPGIRLLGLMCTVFVVWVLLSFVAGSPTPRAAGGGPMWPRRGAIYAGLCLVPCLASITCGILMAVRPKWWIEKHVVCAGAGATGRSMPPWLIRSLSLLLIIPAVYFAVRIVAGLVK